MVYKFLFSRKAPTPIKAAFLDRDGVINIDYAYVSKKEHFDFVEGALEGIRVLVEKDMHPCSSPIKAVSDEGNIPF